MKDKDMIKNIWDLKDRRIARMNALNRAIEYAKVVGKLELHQVLAIADKFLEYIYADDEEFWKRIAEESDEEEEVRDVPDIL